MFRIRMASILIGLSFWAFSLQAVEKEKIIDQSQHIEGLLEKWAAQTIEEPLHKYIEALREALYCALSSKNFGTDYLLKLNRFIVEEINFSCVAKIHLPYSNAEQLLRHITRSGLSGDEETIYYAIEEKIAQLEEVIDALEHNAGNEFMEHLRNLKRGIQPLEIADAVWPYALLFVHWVLLMPQQKMEELFGSDWKWEGNKKRWPGVLRNVIFDFKGLVGGIEKKEKVEKKVSITAGAGAINKTLLDWWKPVVSLDLESSLFKVGIPMLVKDRILSDLKALYGIILASTARCKNRLMGVSKEVKIVPVLSEEGRITYINNLCRNYGIPGQVIDRAYVAHVLEGATEKLINTVFECAVCKAHAHKRALALHDIEESIDIFVRHVDVSALLPDQEKELRAAHFAGLLLMHMLLYADNPVMRVTLLPVKESEGTIPGKLFTYSVSALSKNKNDYLKACMYVLAPVIAQEILLGDLMYDALQNSKKKAVALLEPLVLQGDDWSYIPEKIKQSRLETLYEMIEQCKQQVYIQLLEHQDVLHKMFKKLKKYTTLEHEQITQFSVQ